MELSKVEDFLNMDKIFSAGYFGLSGSFKSASFRCIQVETTSDDANNIYDD